MFSDEVYIEAGESPREKPKISRPKGVNSIEHAALMNPV